MDEDNEEYKSLLIINESNDAKLTLYIYPTWLPISLTSKILQPNEKYLHRDKTAFKYKLVANFDDKREKKEFPGPLELIGDTLIRVTESLECVEENLADYPQEKRICLRKMHLRNELASTSDKVNLYDILGLDMTKIRKLKIGDQKIAIKKAFRDQMRIWHPDKNFGDDEIAMQIILVRETLLDDERRACYHNEADYDEGWLSLKRYKAIFWPDCYTEEQNKAYWHRIGMMAASLGLAIGGVILTALTDGTEAPAAVVCGAIFGAGFTGVGMLSGKHTLTKDSMVTKSWLLKAGIGLVGGAVVCGAAGITDGVDGIGSAALESSAVTAAEFTEGRLDDSVEDETSEFHETNEEGTDQEQPNATFRYKSEGAWISKMIVTYSLHGKENKEEVSGNGRKVKIPSDAKQIEVRFQVYRPVWGDVMKYDRFKKTWCKPYEPHVFRYERPPLERTFTISGNLGWEAVTRVSDEYHEETGEMVGDISLVNVKSADPTESWKWEESSKSHREKFIKIHEYGRTHLQDIKEINDVRVCFTDEFVVGRGNNATKVYVGLSRDGYERAVKRLPRDDSACLAEQEKKILNEPNAVQSKYVVKYRYFDDKSDKDWVFLIMDLCEETLNEYVERSSWENWTKITRDIIQQVLKGLRDLHSCSPTSILHRDLKPTNVLRNVHGKWLIADFGISRILTQNVSTHRSSSKGTKDWKAVETCCSKDESEVRYKRESDIQVAGMVAFYIVTKGEHPFGEEPDRYRNLLDGNPVYLNKLKDPAAKDLISWMIKHKPKDRPTAVEALKHPYLLPMKEKFELLCKMGNQPEIKKGDITSDVVKELNSDPTDWRALMRPDVLNYLCTVSVNGRSKAFYYGSSWTECLRLIRNVNQHWNDRSRPLPQPEAFYVVGDPQEYFLKIFPDLPVVVHRIVRSCIWKERQNLKKFFIKEQKQKDDEIHKKNLWFKNYFLDCDRNLKDEIHELLISFPWFCGAYGVTGPNKNIPHLHLFITFERGAKISNVRRKLQEKFGTDAMEYFELLRQPETTPEFKYLADSNDRSSASSYAPSVLPTPGGGVLGCDNEKCTVVNPMKVKEDEERDDLNVLATGTLTMFCFKDEQHYALTCFHIGRANDGDNLSTPKESDKSNSSQILAKIKTYRFAENDMEHNNEAMPVPFNTKNTVPLGDFHNFDKQSDIMSLKVLGKTDVSCELADVTSPDWKSLWDQMLEDTASDSTKGLKVEKIGFKSGLTYGHIALYNTSYKGKFKNAIAVKGCDNRPFLEEGDSGALVFFRDGSNMKTVFAYGVLEVNELNVAGDDDKDDLGYVYPGPFSICLRLNTALENLNLKEGACVNDCGEGC